MEKEKQNRTWEMSERIGKRKVEVGDFSSPLSYFPQQYDFRFSNSLPPLKLHMNFIWIHCLHL